MIECIGRVCGFKHLNELRLLRVLPENLFTRDQTAMVNTSDKVLVTAFLFIRFISLKSLQEVCLRHLVAVNKIYCIHKVGESKSFMITKATLFDQKYSKNIYISKNCFLFEYVLKCNLFL